MSRVPFEWFAHLVTVPVSAGGERARFVLDTGIGPSLISEALAARSDARDTGRSFTGQRMSGQEVAVPLATAAGTPVELRLADEGCSLDAFLDLTLPGGRDIEVEVDMGSDSLILDAAFAPELGVDLDADGVRTIDGVDETGHAYTRSFTTLSGTIHPAGAPALARADPEVMFQRIIYDGLLGNAFLRDFAVTYDMPGSRAIFAPYDRGPTEVAS